MLGPAWIISELIMCFKSITTFVLITLMSVFCASLSAQDIIVKTDASIIRAVIDEIDENTILYHQWENQSGPAFRIRINQVSRIQFQNGTEQVFSNLKQNINDSPVSPQNVQRYGELEYVGHGDFTLGGRKLDWMDDYQYEELLSPLGYYNTFLSAQKQRVVGNTLLPIGCGVLATGVLWGIIAIKTMPSSVDIMSGDIDEIFSVSTIVAGALTVVGGTLISIAIPLKIIGNSRLRWIANDYNKNLGYTANFIIGPTNNGLGIALVF